MKSKLRRNGKRAISMACKSQKSGAKSGCFSAMPASRPTTRTSTFSTPPEGGGARQNLRGQDHRHGAQAPRPRPRAQSLRRRRRAGGVAARPSRPFARPPDRTAERPRHARRAVPLLTEHIDTTTPTGKLTFHMIGALAEFERALIIERYAGQSEAQPVYAPPVREMPECRGRYDPDPYHRSGRRPQLWALAIIDGRARKQRRFLLGLAANGAGCVLTLSANVLANRASCSRLRGRALGAERPELRTGLRHPGTPPHAGRFVARPTTRPKPDIPRLLRIC